MPKTKTESVFRSVLFSRRKIAVFGLCLVISTLFWVLLAFNEIYTTTITVPVRYVNMPEDQMLIDRLPAEVELEISGVGYRLLSYSLQPETAEITLDGMLTGINPGSKNAEAFLATNGAVLFFNRLHNDVEALRVEPDTIHFTFF